MYDFDFDPETNGLELSWRDTGGADGDDLCSNNEDYLLYTIRIVRIEEPAE